MALDLVPDKAMDALGDKLADGLMATICRAAIERWSAHRAQLFFKALEAAFAEEQAEGIDLPQTVAAIETALAGELTSAMLFDCYRRVCFSRSKDLGPIIIGLLAGKLAAAGRTASPDEEEVFGAAEEMTDRELLGVVGFVDHCLSELAAQTTDYSGTVTQGVTVQTEQRLPSGRLFGSKPASVGPVNLATQYGLWAKKAEALGMLGQDVVQQARPPKGEFPKPGAAAQSVQHTITFRPSVFALATLVRRAHKVVPGQ